jgi:hypothetical protein
VTYWEHFRSCVEQFKTDVSPFYWKMEKNSFWNFVNFLSRQWSIRSVLCVCIQAVNMLSRSCIVAARQWTVFESLPRVHPVSEQSETSCIFLIQQKAVSTKTCRLSIQTLFSLMYNYSYFSDNLHQSDLDPVITSIYVLRLIWLPTSCTIRGRWVLTAKGRKVGSLKSREVLCKNVISNK